MDGLPDNAKILKSLIAPARYSDGPTLFLICQVDDQQCRIYEQLPCGNCQVWPELTERGVQQAEGMIYQRVGTDGLNPLPRQRIRMTLRKFVKFNHVIALANVT